MFEKITFSRRKIRQKNRKIIIKRNFSTQEALEMKKSRRSMTQMSKKRGRHSNRQSNTQTNSRAIKEAGMPQNFNSYRHVITHTTTGDDLNWVLNLREKSAPILTEA